MYPQQPQYPAAPQQPQYPPAPQQPYAPPAPQQPYAPPAPNGYAPQPQYGQPALPPPVPGTLDQFYAQPSTGGGKALSFEAPGTQYTGVVTRAIGNGDIQQQTDTQGRPATFRDGRAKFVMKVPLQMQPSAAYPDGLAQWYVKGTARDELVRAMTEAGAPEGPPEAGSVITITMTGTRPSGPGMNPTKLFQVSYRRPQGAQPTAQPTAAPVAQPATSLVYTGNGNGATTTSSIPPQAPPAPPPPVPAPSPPAPAPAADLSPEQQALLAQLTGQPQPTH